MYWLNLYKYYFMIIELFLEVNVDNVIVMWSVYGEMVNWKWMLMNCFEIDWIMCCCWEWCDYDICWVEDWDIELCWWVRNNLNYCDCGWKFVDLDWNDELCEFFVLWMVMS